MSTTTTEKSSSSTTTTITTTSLAEVYKHCPLLPLHITSPLDFKSVHTLPESHAWSTPVTELISGNDGPTVPIIDLEDPGATRSVGLACETWGVFQIINHGIPERLTEAVEVETQRFFALPAEEKAKVLRGPNEATGYGTARISEFFSKFMWHEGFTIIGSSAADHAKVLWPQAHTHFCEVMEEYEKKMQDLAYKLFLMIIGSLGASEEETKRAASTYDTQGALQLNSYPSCPDPTRAMGLAPHTDSLFLAILQQGRGPDGLQVLREGLGWVPVTPVAGALVVNVGDLLHILSNGRFPSVWHQVAVNRSSQRFSFVYFYGPPTESEVAPLSKVEAPKFRAVTVKEYLGTKAKHLGKALSLVSI